MTVGLNKSFEQFIKWQVSYDTYVHLINEQHREILNFINSWYHKLKEGQQAGNLVDFVKDKFDFLVKFSKGHLRFETELLRLMNQKYGFPQKAYKDHLEKHRWFMEFFLMPLISELRQKGEGDYDHNLLEDIAKQGLVDTARWWYDHIRSPKNGEQPGPDHTYRLHLETLSMADRLEIVNHMAVYVALNTSNYWLIEYDPKQDLKSLKPKIKEIETGGSF